MMPIRNRCGASGRGFTPVPQIGDIHALVTQGCGQRLPHAPDNLRQPRARDGVDLAAEGRDVDGDKVVALDSARWSELGAPV